MSYSPNGWSGRGVEFATQPFDLPHREMVELNRCSTRQSTAGSGEIQNLDPFSLFHVRSPEGMTHVDDVRLENGKLIVEDRAAGKTLTLPASQPL